jgi:hypothetical protein
MEWLGKQVPGAMDTHATEEQCFCVVYAKMLYGEQLKQEQFSWKGATVQRRLEPRSRGIATVRSS